MERGALSDAFPIGSALPQFSLPNVDGTTVSSQYVTDGKAGLVVFTCNHCPYVKGSDEMFLSIVKKYLSKGLKVVAISSNDPVQYPEDSFDKMKEKAKAMALPFPYLFDESQQVAKKFDAQCTPEFYLFDNAGTLVFHGTLSNSPRHPAEVKSDYLSPAIESVFAGKKPDPSFVHPIGCSIKWKQN